MHDDCCLNVKVHASINQFEPAAWDALVRDHNPLLRHAFFAAMEEHGCVGQRFGWLPQHLGLYQDDVLVAALPLFVKTNSYGEFVFDHQWEHAWKGAGRQYFPKLVSAVPYTPATGQRFLMQHDNPLWQRQLAEAALVLAQQLDASGVHILFPLAAQQAALTELGWLSRHDVQFHWHNHNYADFDAFLATLASRKRKAINKERRQVRDAGVTLRRLNGHSATAADWQAMGQFYAKTFEEKWGMATFNQGFFETVAARLPENILLVLADNSDGQCIAGALMYNSDTHLYGRHWGCNEQIDGLHFEACYYQGIEFCIERGLQVFEPGAQGEHKLARGFLPTRTCSSHWVNADDFREPLRAWTRHQRDGIAHYMDELAAHSPYRQSE